MENIYFKLTSQFNKGKTKAILSSGQAVVFYQMSMQSKDGDWIIREDAESLESILDVLSNHGAMYRFGAPLDKRWLQHGWSSHFEFFTDSQIRIRTDFVSRPPRLNSKHLEVIWEETGYSDFPVINLDCLSRIKRTLREKDYIVIGEIARKIPDNATQLLHSRSPEDIIRILGQDPDAFKQAAEHRPLLHAAKKGIRELRRELDEERWDLIDSDRERMEIYSRAAASFRAEWNNIKKETKDLGLRETHQILVKQAEKFLPRDPYLFAILQQERKNNAKEKGIDTDHEFSL